MSPKLNSIEWAIESGNVALVQRLLGHGVPLEVFLEAARVRMILIAAATGRVFMLQFLRQYGVIPVPSNEEAQSAMRSAMRRGDSKPQNISSIKDLTRLTRPLNEGLVTKTATTTTTAPDLTWEMLLKLSTLKRQKRPLTYFCVMKQLTSLCLLLEGAPNPLPNDRFGSSMLAQAAEKKKSQKSH
ncbi:hypothetical protein N7537_003928 [Penicillium hordei]|uniref:Uncharacterized protein n=1 Tax=Penicillium hordei TaxID=40994 RepID=A0AAD6EAS9_9EURO|nr:uncharacterized protein N7537_003928 [Penicillium hordei]KAJ5607309.1 hypothetical protein N7537_003928 [Penicillium hordei]